MPKTNQPDQFDFFLIRRTEQILNTGFLWILILKLLLQKPSNASDLRKEISHKHFNPHKTTFYSSIYLLKGMKLIELAEGKLYQITPKGKIILERAIKHLRSNLAIILGGD